MVEHFYGYALGYATDEVSTVKACEANLNEENRIKFVTDLAAISRGKSESANPPKRYQALLKEAAPTQDTIDTYNTLSDNGVIMCPKCKSGTVEMHNDTEKVEVATGVLETKSIGMEIKCSKCGYTEYSVNGLLPNWKSKLEGSPSRPLEFCPVMLDCQIMSDNPLRLSIVTKSGNWVTMWGDDFLNNLSKFGYVEYNELPHDQSSFKLFTNMRACLNAGIDYEDIPYNTVEELKDFKAVKAKIPMFVFNHLITHTAISKESRSERMVDISDVDYWLPEDLRKRTYNVNYQDPHMIPNELQDIFHSVLTKTSIDGVVYDFIHKYSQHTIMQFLKYIGYPKEIYQRAMLEFRYKEMIMTGWFNDPKVWKHLFTERNANQDVWKNWTQEQTSTAVKAIRNIVDTVYYNSNNATLDDSVEAES
jgi:predicted nucleic-acid-binding Zn-ribbon protein